ncbi:MAG: EscU/YscU/HrcU family type III secretion system export apparatus switch protein [Spirochaetia bacterium]|nr:EscU/YscU/HrcU family type III secretion system export apparatus switch protein [Spirochaetia bacterium]
MSSIDLQWFAAEDEGRTEEASEEKLRKAREEGRIAKSTELNSAIVYLLTVILLTAIAPWMKNQFCQILVYYFNNVTAEKIDSTAFYIFFLRSILMLVLPFGLVGMIAGIAANIAQNKGWIFTTKKLNPNFSAIVPHFGQWLKKSIFSLEGVFNIFKSIIKVAVIGIVSFMLIKNDLAVTLNFMRTGGPALALNAIGSMTSKLLIISAVILLVISIADYIVQRRTFLEQMKMTKQEVKEEIKESEPNPEVKGRIESAQKEMFTRDMPKAVREADVVVTNPTEYAVALGWDRETSSAPQVTAKGVDTTAQVIKRIARENDVPTVENIPLARSLYDQVEIGSQIPVEYLRAVSVVYVQIGYLDRQNEKNKKK